ncbi:MAG: hypothetical protein HC860_12880 [Alkalinema sp. RU_4_3]|nr:hypothetical protein [Alkalinema sp. RU_4_3]
MDGQQVSVNWNLLGQLLRCGTVVEVERLLRDEGCEVGDLMGLVRVGLEQVSDAGVVGQLVQVEGLLRRMVEEQSVAAQGRVEVAKMAAAEKFLRETLELIGKTQGNPQQVYPVWRQQPERFNEELLALVCL